MLRSADLPPITPARPVCWASPSPLRPSSRSVVYGSTPFSQVPWSRETSDGPPKRDLRNRDAAAGPWYAPGRGGGRPVSSQPCRPMGHGHIARYQRRRQAEYPRDTGPRQVLTPDVPRRNGEPCGRCHLPGTVVDQPLPHTRRVVNGRCRAKVPPANPHACRSLGVKNARRATRDIPTTPTMAAAHGAPQSPAMAPAAMLPRLKA